MRIFSGTTSKFNLVTGTLRSRLLRPPWREYCCGLSQQPKRGTNETQCKRKMEQRNRSIESAWYCAALTTGELHIATARRTDVKPTKWTLSCSAANLDLHKIQQGPMRAFACTQIGYIHDLHDEQIFFHPWGAQLQVHEDAYYWVSGCRHDKHRPRRVQVTTSPVLLHRRWSTYGCLCSSQ